MKQIIWIVCLCASLLWVACDESGGNSGEDGQQGNAALSTDTPFIEPDSSYFNYKVYQGPQIISFEELSNTADSRMEYFPNKKPAHLRAYNYGKGGVSLHFTFPSQKGTFAIGKDEVTKITMYSPFVAIDQDLDEGSITVDELNVAEGYIKGTFAAVAVKESARDSVVGEFTIHRGKGGVATYD